MKCVVVQTWGQKSNQIISKKSIQWVCMAARFRRTDNGMCV